MASKVQAVTSASSTKLPVITEGRSLVSPTQVSKAVSIKDQAKEWATDIRQRIEKNISQGDEPDESDIYRLRQELVALFIIALQKDSRQCWMLLREALMLLEPIKQFLLTTKHELHHYLERIDHHLDANKERLFDLHVSDALHTIFPLDMQHVQDSGMQPKKNYNYPSPPKSLAPTRLVTKQSPPKVPLLMPGARNPFKLQLLEDKDLKPKAMTFGDIRASLPEVALEMATREAIWSACLGTTAIALNINLPEEAKEPSPPTSRQSSKTRTLRSSRSEDNLSEGSDDSAMDFPSKPMTGREAVEYFSKCYHTGAIEFMYFNVAPSRNYKPYDLIAVKKGKADPEHFVFSTFGVLHVYPDQPSENMSLADWQREAVLFKAISHIPFFKHYLVRKMLRRWRGNVHFADFASVRHKVGNKLLQAVPSLGAALLQITNLCDELSALKLLPQDNQKCYQLLEFENAVFYLNTQADKVLERFYRYIKIIVDTTAEELGNRVIHCEQQVNQKAVFTKDSLHLQRLKREQREENLRIAREEVGCLPRFVELVDYMLLSCMVKLVRTSVMGFVHQVMNPTENVNRDGLFTANLLFGLKAPDYLTLSPPKEKFVGMLNRMIEEMATLCTSAVEALEGDDLDSLNPLSPLPTTGKISSRGTSMTKSRVMVGTSAQEATRQAAAKEATSEAERMLHSPQLQLGDIPLKTEDDMGQATPRMVVPPRRRQDLSSSQAGIMSRYKSVTRNNLETKLTNDESYQVALKQQAQMLKDALNETDEYCKKNAWLNEIYKFCKTWTADSVYEWQGAAAFTIEQKLNELRQWIDRVRNFDKSYITDNAIFNINCCGIHDLLVPKLSAILKELCAFVAEESANLAKKFLSAVKVALENLKKKETSIGGFAIYARHVSNYKKNTPQYLQNVEYIKSLNEVIRMGYRQLTQEEEKMDEVVWHNWEAFLFAMQSANEFVSTQTPIITQDLEDTYQRLEERARQLSEEATSGRFLDPNQDPTQVLFEMTEIRDEFYEVQRQMQQASKWKEAITGEPYDLSFLKNMAVQMDIREELWKFIEVSTHQIKEWKRQMFRKLNIRKALDKVTEWQAAAGQLKCHLPQADEVLTNWYRHLQDFKLELPYLHRLSHEALKPRHWKAIFVGIGEQFDCDHSFTVQELLSYNLCANGQVINKVYQAALTESNIEQNLLRLSKLWQEKEFKLAKHIPDSVYKEDGKKSKDSTKKLKRLEKFRQDKAAATASCPHTLEVKQDSLYIIVDTEELNYLLEDGLVTLQKMLASPFLADHVAEAQHWSHCLREISEILDLWITAQTKWLYLLKIFEEPDIYRRMESQAARFESIHAQFSDFMMLVLADPKVTSVLSRPRGNKGFKILQGERLRDMFIDIIQSEEEILKHLGGIFDISRAAFPRLYFLSDDELVELLSISRNPTALVPFVRKCFSGIDNLTFDLPTKDNVGIESALDFTLNAHKLEVTSIEGVYGEVLPLYEPLEAGTNTSNWLSQLELTMKTTLNTTLQHCVQARLEDALMQPVKILEEVSRYEALQNDVQHKRLASEIKQQYGHWLLRFPSQCVLVAEAVIWERSIFKALERQDREQLADHRSGLTSRVEQYVKVLQENLSRGKDTDDRMRLHSLLTCLVNQALHHRDVLNNLLKNKSLSDGGYDWLKLLKYHMEIHNVLRANTATVGTRDKTLSQDRERPKTSDGNIESRPKLSRTMTQISTGYQFGKCMVSQMGSMFAYDCEYLGPSPRLVFTPLTERAYLTLTMAIKQHQCGTLMGPPATGKSETVRDLAQALGRQLVGYNCCEELTLPVLNQIMTGMVHSGCWALFDDVDRLPYGLASVMSQQLDYLSNAYRVLSATSDNQYGIRGQPRFDKVTTRAGSKRIRRNSLTTLHSLPASESPSSLERQATVPHGFNEEGLTTYFADTWIKERERRHSIEKEIKIRESDLYKTNRPPPLFYEFVTQHMKPKPTFEELVQQFVPYMPTYVGNVLFNGKLVQANANYGCFMTMTTTNPSAAEIPNNLRLCMRPCAMVIPDIRMVIEMEMYCNGFQNHKSWSGKLAFFIQMLKAQLPSNNQYDLGVKTVMAVLFVASVRFHEHLIQERKNKLRGLISEKKSSIGEMSPEEEVIIKAISMIIASKMANNEDAKVVKNVMRDVFPQSARPKSANVPYAGELVQAVEDQMRQENLQVSPDLVDKILLLYSALQTKQGVIMIGPTGSGKTTGLSMLAKTLSKLHFGNGDDIKEDELMPERSLTFMYSQKLKVLQESEMRDSARVQPKKWQKLTNMSSLLSRVTRNFASVVEEAKEEERKKVRYPRISVNTIMPNVFKPEELFGMYTSDGLWQRGLLSKVITEAHNNVQSAKWFTKNYDDKKASKKPIDTPSIIQKWIILDGNLEPAWVDSMNTLLDNGKQLTLANGGHVKLHDMTSLIFEMTHLMDASPSTVAQCGLVCCHAETVTWKSLWETWGQNAKQTWVINTSSWQVLTSLANSVFPASITFLKNNCSPALLSNTGHMTREANQAGYGVQEVTSFLRILSAILDRHFRRDEMEKVYATELNVIMSSSPSKQGRGSVLSESAQSRLTSSSRLEDLIHNYMSIIKSLFAFAYIWSFGGNLNDESSEKFNTFARDTLRKASQPVMLPDAGSVYDYWVDSRHGSFQRWSDRQMERSRGMAANYNLIPEIDRYNYLIDLMVTSHYPVLITGEAGVGKTALIENVIQTKHQYTKMAMSKGMTTGTLQNIISSRVIFNQEAQVKGALLPGKSGSNKVKTHHLFFMDDLAIAKTAGNTKTQPVLELLRQILTLGGVFDHKRQVFSALPPADYIAVARTAGGPGESEACQVLSSRLVRLFTVFTMFSYSDQTLHSIYSRTVQAWMEEFPGSTLHHHYEFTKALVQGIIDVYRSVKAHMKPTPAQPHYIFSLHDISHVVNGILLMSPRSKIKPSKDKSQPPPIQKRGSSLSMSVDTEAEQGPPPMMRVIARLWCHENTRVFGDRLISHEDEQWFESLVHDTVVKLFCSPVDADKMSTIPEDAMSQNVPTPASTSPSNMASPQPTSLMDQAAALVTSQTPLEGTFSAPPEPSTHTAEPQEEQPEQEQTQQNIPTEDKAAKTKTPVASNTKKNKSAGKKPTSPGKSSTLTPGAMEPDVGGNSSEEEEDEEDEEETSEEESGSEESEEELVAVTSFSGTSPAFRGLRGNLKPSNSFNSGKFDKVRSDTYASLKSTGSRRPTGSRGGKRQASVSFKVGLLADREAERYYGALMSLDQIREPGESLTGFIFSKYIMSSYAEAHGLKVGKGYMEATESVLWKALDVCASLYNTTVGKKLDLVFFKQAAQHVARLSRVLATPGGHGLLLGTDYCTGRATLVRLAAHLSNCKLFEPEKQSTESGSREALREQIRKCSKMAAIVGRQVVLLVKDELGDGSLHDVCDFLKHGHVPGLYTPDEIQVIASQVTPGQVKMTRIDKVEAAFTKFLSRVRQNLHVVVCMSYRDGAPGERLLMHQVARFPSLLYLCCCVDIYRPWTMDAYVTIAEKMLHKSSNIPVLWNEAEKLEQISLVAEGMAYIHTSSKVAIEKLHCHQRQQYKFFTPLTFKEFIYVFRVINAYIVREEKAKMEKYEAGLARVNEAFHSISEYKREVSNLVPQHQSALCIVKDHVDFVEVQREEYIKALDRCREQEEIIEAMMEPLDQLRQEAQAEFDKVNPVYHAAVETLSCLSSHDVAEVKSFHTPPRLVKEVLNVICLLFDKPQDWENAKLLMVNENFFRELEFYDKNNIPDKIFLQLADFYHNPDMNEDNVKKVNLATVGLIKWAKAVYQYAAVLRKMKPKMKRLNQAQEQLDQAQLVLGAKRVEANRIKSALEARILAHKEAVHEAKTIEKKIQSIDRKIRKASHLMDKMSMQNMAWKTELRQARSKLRTAPADALLAAACVCYHGPLDNCTRAELMQDWLMRCEEANFDPNAHVGQQVKSLTLTTKLDDGSHPQPNVKPLVSISETSSGLPDGFQAEVVSHKADDLSSLHETERASSASSVQQMSVYKQRPSIYDIGVSVKTEVRLTDSAEAAHDGTETKISANKNLLVTREGFTLQDVLSTFEELCEWKDQELPSDVYSLHNALILRVICHVSPQSWPLLVDPDGQAELWIRVTQRSQNIIKPAALEQEEVEEEDEEEFTDEITEDLIGRSSRGTDHTSGANTRLTTPHTGRTTMDDSNPLMNSVNINQVKNGHELKVAEAIQRPEDNMWVIPANDPGLEEKFINAIVHGVTLVVTHLERKPLDAMFKWVLRKDKQVDLDGETMVAVGDSTLQWHPDFSLYLCSSTSLFLQGEGIHELPVQEMGVVDMAISQEGIINKLLANIMALERPEFEGQKKSIEGDAVHHQHEITREQEIIVQKTLDLKHPILEDKTMLDALVECQKNVQANQTILEETRYLHSHLEEKRTPYVSVATHGAKLYELVQRVCVLNPLYHMRLDSFCYLVNVTIKGRHRGKGTQGAPKARAQELVNSITSAVYNDVSFMMFEHHTQLFALLVTMERLRMSQQLTNQELALFVNGVDTSEVDDNIVFDDMPGWASSKMWLDCAAMEMTMPCFRGLKQSLITYSEVWKEYFQCPVSLIDDLPDDSLDLTVFQKCLLWRICAPHKMSEVSAELVLYELGGMITPSKNYNIKHVYSKMSNSKPVILIQPPNHGGSPVQDIYQFSKENDMDGRVHLVTCGVDTQMAEVQHALRECAANGYWLVLQNAHLAEQWGTDLLNSIKSTLGMRTDIDPEVLCSSSPMESLQSDSRGSLADTEVPQEQTHKDFRLFITTQSETGRLVPGYLIQYALKVACGRTQNFQSNIQRTYENVDRMILKKDRMAAAIKKLFGSMDPVLPLAVLHSTLLHRQSYGHPAFVSQPHWSSNDLATSVEYLNTVALLSGRHTGIPDILGHIYSGHCLDIGDQKIVESLSEGLVLSPKQMMTLGEEEAGISSLLGSLMPRDDCTFTQCVDALTKVNGHVMNLPVTADSELAATTSKRLLDDLVRVLGSPDLVDLPPEVTFRKAELMLHDFLVILNDLPDLPKPKSDGFYPMEIFLHSETHCLRKNLQTVQSDATLLLGMARGEVASNSKYREMLLAISQHQMPQSWLCNSFPSSLSITQWATILKKRIELLKQYIMPGDGVIVYDVGVFTRPDYFFQCVTLTHARKQFKDLLKLRLDVQVMPADIPINSSPPFGVYIRGLQLHNACWDSTKCCLKQQVEDSSQPYKMPTIWLKPVDVTMSANKIKHDVYQCPVYVDSSSQFMGHENNAITLALPTSLPPSLWLQNRVHLSCTLAK